MKEIIANMSKSVPHGLCSEFEPREPGLKYVLGKHYNLHHHLKYYSQNGPLTNLIVDQCSELFLSSGMDDFATFINYCILSTSQK